MNISLCITVKNEEKSIGPLLDSIFAGTKKPDEIIIVDGGSTDKTLSVINNYQLPLLPLKSKQQNLQRQNPNSPNYPRNF